MASGRSTAEKNAASVALDATKGGSLPAREAHRRLVRTAGAFARDFGLSRVVGELLMHLYLTEGDESLDKIESELGLSKAAVSIAARRLEMMGLLVRVRKPGDRRRYYRTADHLDSALRLGVLTLLRRKIGDAAAELEAARRLLSEGGKNPGPRERFLLGRIRRAEEVRRRIARLLENPLARWLMNRQ